MKAVHIAVWLALACAASATADDYNWQATGLQGVQVREGLGTSCGSMGKYHYHQFKNTGTRPVSFYEIVRYTTDGRSREDVQSTTLTPGGTSLWGGSWVCADRGVASVSASVTPPPPAQPAGAVSDRHAEVPPAGGARPLFAGGDASPATPSQTAPARVTHPALGRVRLDSDCINELKHEAAMLQAGQAYQKFLSWSPLASSLADGRPVEVAISLGNQDWSGITEAISGVGEMTRLLMRDAAMIHATQHPYGSDTRRFWEELEKEYAQDHR